jgi:hypothetical protein
MVFTVLGAVAELERELIRERVEAVFPPVSPSNDAQLTLLYPPAYTNFLRRGLISPRASCLPWQVGYSTRRSLGSSSGILRIASNFYREFGAASGLVNL